MIRPLFAASLVLMSGCMDAPVAWNEPVAVANAPASGRLAVDTAGHVSMRDSAEWPRSRPSDPALCQSSFRSTADGATIQAVWWSARDDSSAELYASATQDGGTTWTRPSVVDSTDHADVGCARPAPSIIASNGNVYIAYAMRDPQGMGVFFSHQMAADNMPGMFHSPVTVIYGDRLVSVAVAADGDHIAVAYEDPSGKSPRIDLALSSTQGHSFDSRSIASSEPVSAATPDVALAWPVVVVSWSGAEGGRMTRVGRIR